jgi:hypothetical protein
MSTPVLGFPEPSGSVAHFGPSSPFDVSGIAAAIDRAAASLKPEERAAVTVQLSKTEGFGAGLVVRVPLGPLDAAALATVTRPLAGAWGWSLSGRVSFLAGVPTPLKPVRVAPELRGLYRLFRAAGNGKLRSAFKAAAAARGVQVTLRG